MAAFRRAGQGAGTSAAVLTRAADALRTVDPAAALSFARRAVAAGETDPEAHKILGVVLWDVGYPAGAAVAFARAVALAPDDARFHANLAAAHRDLHDVAKAIQGYRDALERDPGNADALNGLGTLLQRRGQAAAAIDHYRRALTIRPDDAQAVGNLATALLETGDQAAAEALSARALALAPDDPGVASNHLYGLHYLGRLTPDAMVAEHRRVVAPWLRPAPPYANDRTPDRRLRVGYVSPDFRDHPVARFLLPMLARHDPSQVELFAYASGSQNDAVTTRLRQAMPQWREIRALDDDRAATIIAGDGIDVLVDLAGHTASNRLPLFARAPAPVQVTWLGYPGTTGLSSFVARVVDAITDPPGNETQASEPLARIAGGFLAFDPLVPLPDPGPAPSIAAGHVTFGAFSNLAKITDEVIDRWSEILQTVGDARLFMKARALRDPAIREATVARFAGRGIDASRLTLTGFRPGSDHHADQRLVDIALDPFPYNGTTTTCEALWMGVPVVTLAGDRHAARVGASILTHVGLPDLIADTPGGYVETAVALARDPARRAHLRATLRERCRQSPLGDGARLASEMEALYRRLWRDWCTRA